uniref:Uncharacterized protein n=1 Tax=Meloidogyne incognita TaxID=6306 RepID=A0A914MBJ9_MELIC
MCMKSGNICDDKYAKCCESESLTCKSVQVGGHYLYKCSKGDCVHENNSCNGKDKKCCYPFRCVDSKCIKCTPINFGCNNDNECCSGQCTPTFSFPSSVCKY